jgi:PhoD-like phosphatase
MEASCSLDLVLSASNTHALGEQLHALSLSTTTKCAQLQSAQVSHPVTCAGGWRVRKAVSTRVFHEWMPTRTGAFGTKGYIGFDIGRTFTFGNLAKVVALENRLTVRSAKLVLLVPVSLTARHPAAVVQLPLYRFSWKTGALRHMLKPTYVVPVRVDARQALRRAVQQRTQQIPPDAPLKLYPGGPFVPMVGLLGTTAPEDWNATQRTGIQKIKSAINELKSKPARHIPGVAQLANLKKVAVGKQTWTLVEQTTNVGDIIANFDGAIKLMKCAMRLLVLAHPRDCTRACPRRTLVRGGFAKV